MAFLRKRSDTEQIMAIYNFSPVPSQQLSLRRRRAKGIWREMLNTDAKLFGGTGHGNLGGVETVPIGLHGRPYSITLDLPPLSGLYLKWEPSA